MSAIAFIFGVAIKAKVCAVVAGFPAHLVPAHLVPAHLVPAHQLTKNASGGAGANVNQLTNVIKYFNKTLKNVKSFNKIARFS